MIHARATGARMVRGGSDHLFAGLSTRAQLSRCLQICILILIKLNQLHCYHQIPLQSRPLGHKLQHGLHYTAANGQLRPIDADSRPPQPQAVGQRFLRYDASMRSAKEASHSYGFERQLKPSPGGWINSIKNAAKANHQVHLRAGPYSKRGHLIYHHHQQQAPDSHEMLRTLPNGPPPFRPPALALGLNSLGALEKLKRTKIFKRMYKSKVYYLFLDVLQQLVTLVELIAKKKIDITKTNVATVQAVASRLLVKGSQHLKLKWPLVMLNPNFIKEVLANPTFLVMLFHTIEVAYMSLPMSFWLKPFVKLVRQPSPEKEEEVWWRRKRIYDVLNGHGASELEPNLKSVHFRNPGEPAPFTLAGVVQTFRQMTGRPGPQPAHHNNQAEYSGTHLPKYETASMESSSPQAFPADASTDHPELTYLDGPQYQYHDYAQPAPIDTEYSNAFMTGTQEEMFLANQKHYDARKIVPTSMTNHADHPMPESSNPKPHMFTPMAVQDFKKSSIDFEPQIWPNSASSNLPQELMSQDEFNMLDPREREIVLRATRHSLSEAQLADEIIRQQSEFLESIARRQDGVVTERQPAHRRTDNGSNLTSNG